MCSFQCQLGVVLWDYCHEHCCNIEKPRLLKCHNNCCKNTFITCPTCILKWPRFCKIWSNLYDYHSYQSQTIPKGHLHKIESCKTMWSELIVRLTNRIVVSVCTCHQSNLQSTGLISAFCMTRLPQFVRIHTKSRFNSARMTWIKHRLKETYRNGRYGTTLGWRVLHLRWKKMILSLQDKETYRYWTVSLQ